MDLVTSCKEELAHFLIKDLKVVLTQLGLSKQGKKQDLVDRILAVISDDRASRVWANINAFKKEEVAKHVIDTYRKLQVPGSTNSVSKSQNVSNVTFDTTLKKEVEEDSYQTEKVRCLCGKTLKANSTIKCEDKKCNTRQHISCVIIPEKPLEGIQPTPPATFYCELCRIAHADPFWVSLKRHLVHPVKFTISNVSIDGTSRVQKVEKTFQLTKADRVYLSKPEFEIQAWCILLNDKVSFRMQWPQYAELKVNGVPVRAINRPGSQLLGANGRDDGPLITQWTHEGSNRISLTGSDARVFCFGVRMVQRRTLQQILNLIPRENVGERFEDALARVCRCVGGVPTTENADSDSDLKFVSDSISVNVRCPMSGSRMKVAGRFKPCAHMGCFDLEVFVQMNQRSRKWQCPICLKNYSLKDVIIDPYFNRITTKLRDCGEDVTEIEVKPDGYWRVKAETDQKSLGQLGQWHLPDGTLFVPMEIESKPKPEPLKHVKHEDGSESHNTGLKLGLRKNKNGLWEVSKPEILHSLSSGRDGDDLSINQDGGGHFGHSTTNVADVGSFSSNMDPGYGFPKVNPPSAGAVSVADVIVLSDSDEETENRVSSGPVHNKNNTFSGLPQTEDNIIGSFNDGDDDEDFGVQFWSSPSKNQAGPGFEFLGSDIENAGHGLGGPTSMDGFTLTNENEIGVNVGPDTSLYQSDIDMNDELVDNPLAFGHNDPSLQLFLPTRSPVVSEHVDPNVSTGLNVDDWISLGLVGNTGVSCEPAPLNALNLIQQPPPRDRDMDDKLVDNGTEVGAASLVLGMNDSNSGKTKIRERSDDPFIFPRQKRSSRPRPRPRLYISTIQTDSEQDR